MNEWISIGLNLIVLIVLGLIGIIIRNFKDDNKEVKGIANEARDMAISQEQRIITLENLVEKLATKEGQSSLSTKIDHFYTLVNNTANNLIVKHVDQEGEYRKTVIAANANSERMEKKNKELEIQIEKLKRQK